MMKEGIGRSDEIIVRKTEEQEWKNNDYEEEEEWRGARVVDRGLRGSDMSK